MFETIGIKQKITEMSLVGRSVVEVYFKMEHQEAILTAIGNTKMLLKDFDIMATSQVTNKNKEELTGHLVSRLGNLVSRNLGLAFRNFSREFQKILKLKQLQYVRGRESLLKRRKTASLAANRLTQCRQSPMD